MKKPYQPEKWYHPLSTTAIWITKRSRFRNRMYFTISPPLNLILNQEMKNYQMQKNIAASRIHFSREGTDKSNNNPEMRNGMPDTITASSLLRPAEK